MVDDLSKPLLIRNTGKYAIGFKLACKPGLVKDVITITPEQGNIDPGKDATIQVGGKRPRGIWLIRAARVWSYCLPACLPA